jgi:DNA processing protein
MSSPDQIYQVALSLVPGVGDVLIRNLVSHCGSARGVFEASLGKLLRIRGIGRTLTDAIRQRSTFPLAERLIQTAADQGAQLLFYTDDAYPQRLKGLYDAPALLFYQGTADLNAARTLGLVGTRQASDAGKRLTEEIVEALAPYEPVIVSGLAFGIDIAAHRAALKAGLPTLAVVASGVDICYPAAHQKTAAQLRETGGLLSEHPFGTSPDPRFFLARNRIIAGLSDAVVVVESARRGGALSTAEHANNYHREVFAVPGSPKNPLAEGCNALIRTNKAAIFTAPPDIVEALRWDAAPGTANAERGVPDFDYSSFTEDESQVLSLLRARPELHVDELSWQSQIAMNQLASLLLNLEFQGLVRSLPGKRYALA